MVPKNILPGKEQFSVKVLILEMFNKPLPRFFRANTNHAMVVNKTLMILNTQDIAGYEQWLGRKWDMKLS